MNTTYIAYEGPSNIDKKPIMVLVQVGSRNDKTGGMTQTYIMRSDIDPIKASRIGEDYSICGNCPHRGVANPTKNSGWADRRACYVNLLHGPNGKYKAYKKGSYQKMDIHSVGKAIAGTNLRIGTYGDPSAVPQEVWDILISYADGHTAYTHGDTNPSPVNFMTSADSYEQAQDSWAKGERTFRILNSILDLDKDNEFLCPATKEGGQRTTCDKCGLCAGTSVRAKSVGAVVHGAGKKHFA